MRISWLPLRLFNAVAIDRTLPLRDLVRRAADFGFDGLEIQWKLLDSLDPAYIERVRSWLDEAGLPCSMLTPAPDFTNPDPVARERELATYRQVIDAAVVLGTPTVRVTDGMDRPEASYQVKLQAAVESMLRSQKYAGTRGITLAFENHWKDYYWEYPEFAGPRIVYLDVLNRVRDAGIKVNFDFSNGLMWDYTPLEMYQSVRGLIVNVHASDRQWVGGKLVHWGVGEGIVDFPPVLRQMKEDGYNSWICVEDNNPHGDESTARSLKWLRDLWTSLPG
jgi:sugar phosphate isomerase/epimerase